MMQENTTFLKEVLGAENASRCNVSILEEDMKREGEDARSRVSEFRQAWNSLQSFPWEAKTR